MAEKNAILEFAVYNAVHQAVGKTTAILSRN